MSAKVIPSTKIPKNLKILSVAKNSGRTFSYLPVSAPAGSDVTDISCAATASGKRQKSVFDFSCRCLDIRDSWLSTSWSSISWDLKYVTSSTKWIDKRQAASGRSRSLTLAADIRDSWLSTSWSVSWDVKYVTQAASGKWLWQKSIFDFISDILISMIVNLLINIMGCVASNLSELTDISWADTASSSVTDIGLWL